MKFRIAFSGGGFRATFFSIGVYRRLVELNLHNNVTHIDSVSGGSFAAAQIMCALSDSNFKSVQDFDERVTKPLIKLGQCQLRRKILRKVFYPSLPRNRFSTLFPLFLDELIFKDKKLTELPSSPQWSCHSTCLNTGKRFRFKQNELGGNSIGVTKDIHDIKVSFAVACSAAFPMMFAPIKLQTGKKQFYKKWWSDNPVLNTENLPKNLFLSDGGVYDNLGSESIIKYKGPFIICDASAFLENWDNAKKPNWFSLTNRPLDTGLEQVVLLRRRLLYHESKGSYGIQLLLRDPVQTFIDDPERFGKLSDQQFNLPNYKTISLENQHLLSRLRTDLDGFHVIEIESLMWSGATKIDVVIKKYLQNLISLELVEDVPRIPNYPDDHISEILKLGSKINFFSNLHKKLK
jgi:predicted acylesterase/phospholipase RssA